MVGNGNPFKKTWMGDNDFVNGANQQRRYKEEREEKINGWKSTQRCNEKEEIDNIREIAESESGTLKRS